MSLLTTNLDFLYPKYKKILSVLSFLLVILYSILPLFFGFTDGSSVLSPLKLDLLFAVSLLGVPFSILGFSTFLTAKLREQDIVFFKSIVYVCLFLGAFIFVSLLKALGGSFPVILFYNIIAISIFFDQIFFMYTLSPSQKKKTYVFYMLFLVSFLVSLFVDIPLWKNLILFIPIGFISLVSLDRPSTADLE